jgi:hypothetical protein
VLGNTVPACQTCNDSRGDNAWRPFLQEKFPGDSQAQIAKVEHHLSKFNYRPVSVENSLSSEEQITYAALVQEWEGMLVKARQLRESAEKRRKNSEKLAG